MCRWGPKERRMSGARRWDWERGRERGERTEALEKETGGGEGERRDGEKARKRWEGKGGVE